MKNRIIGFALTCALLAILVLGWRAKPTSDTQLSWRGDVNGSVTLKELNHAGHLLEYYTIYPEEPLVAFPLDIGHTKAWQEIRDTFPEQVVAVLPNATLVEWTTVITQDNRAIVVESGPGVSPATLTEEVQMQLYGNLKLPEVRKIAGRVLWLASECNYYHWLVDFLPRLALVEKAGLEYDKVVVGELRYPFQKQALEALGIPKEKWIERRDEEAIKADELIVTSCPSSNFISPKWAYDYIRSKLLPKTPTKPHRRLYISREGATKRRVLNEAEVTAWLRTQDFEIIKAENYTLAEQAKLFAEAEIVVSPHGAALASTMFCEPGTSVVEFHLNRWRVPCFSAISQKLNLDHHAFLGGDPFPDTLKGKIQKGYAKLTKDSIRDDITIPMYLLQQTVKAAIAKKQQAWI